MAGKPTDWELSQVKYIDNLINNCTLRSFVFQREHNLLNTKNKVNVVKIQEQASQRLQLLVKDLYSALDHMYYLCYCHSKENGQPSDSNEARNVKFPYKLNLETSDSPEQDQSDEFVKDEFKTIFGREPNLDVGNPDCDQYQNLKDIVVNCQKLTKVDSDGNPLETQKNPTDDAKAFNKLHFLRNCVIHRNMVVTVNPGQLYINLKKGWHQITPDVMKDREKNKDWQSFEIACGCWITVPSVAQTGKDTAEPLLTLIPSLLTFVKTTRDNLLKLAFSPHYNNKGGISDFNDIICCGSNGVYIGEEYHCSLEDLQVK